MSISIHDVPLGSDPHAAPAVPAFEGVVAEHGAGVWRTLRNLGVPDADLQDACQDVFIVVHRKLGEFRRDSSLRTWIYGICLRVAGARRRRAHRKYELLLDEVPEVAAQENPEADIDLQRERVLLQQLLMGLDDAKRQVFVLYEIEQLTMAEIVQALGCPLRTGYSRLEAARREITQAWNRAKAARRREP